MFLETTRRRCWLKVKLALARLQGVEITSDIRQIEDDEVPSSLFLFDYSFL
jgi:hypothetical protein